MLVTTATASSRPLSLREADETQLGPKGGNPLPITPVPDELDWSVNHPVYGKYTPSKGVMAPLDQQALHTLDRWHRIADEICQEYDRIGAAEITVSKEAYYEKVGEVACEIYRAAMNATMRSAGDVAILLGLIVRHTQTHQGDTFDNLTVDELHGIAYAAERLSRPPAPQKKVGLLRRGNKLTRAGLLHRYHAFLGNELRTVGLELYGSTDYALHFNISDAEVEDRCGRMSRHAFHNQKTLIDRAKAVFQKLKINSTLDDVNGGSR